ncbi:MAG TPA: hypothetical protein VGL77_14320 [Armatimonadota bacterium]
MNTRTKVWLWGMILLLVAVAAYGAWSIQRQSLQMHEIVFGPPVGNAWYRMLPPAKYYEYRVIGSKHETVITNIRTGEHWKCNVSGDIRGDGLTADGQFMAIIHEMDTPRANRQIYCSLFERPGRLRGYFRLPDNQFGYVYPSLDGHAVLYQRYDKLVSGGLRQAIFVR